MPSKFLLFLKGQKKGQAEKEAEPRLQGQRGGANLLSEGWEERHLGWSRSSRGAPGSRGQAQRPARLGAVLEAPTERTAQEITAPFRPRLRRSGQSGGAPSVRKNSQTRPRAAGDRSSRPPPAAVQAGQVRAGASARTRAAAVKRGLGCEALGSEAPLGGGREGQPAAALQVRASSLRPEKLRLQPQGQHQRRCWTPPRVRSETCSGHSVSN